MPPVKRNNLKHQRNKIFVFEKMEKFLANCLQEEPKTLKKSIAGANDKEKINDSEFSAEQSFQEGIPCYSFLCYHDDQIFEIKSSPSY